MTETAISCAIVGYGAIAESHVAAMRAAGVPLRAVVGPKPDAVSAFARRHGIPRAETSLETVLAATDIEAVVIASPSPVHAEQAVAALRSGKHVLCEIPVGLSLSDSEAVHEAARETGLVAMVCHTQRFWPPMVALNDLLDRQGLTVRHVVARTCMRRHDNVGWSGYRRSWVDNLLWHHGCHAIDSTLQLIGGEPVSVFGDFGPPFARTGLPMDIGVLLRGQSAAIGTIALSYNSMISTSDFLVIAEEDTFFLDRGRLLGRDGSMLAGGDGTAMQDAAVAAQDLEFVSAVRAAREPLSSVASVLATMRVLQRVQDMRPQADG